MATRKTEIKKIDSLRVKTNIKAGGRSIQHNQTVARPAKGLRIKTNIKAGIGTCTKGRICTPPDPNHNQTVARAARSPRRVG
jgi:hypothetical protein